MTHSALGSLLASLLFVGLALPSLAADVSTSPGRSVVFETRHFVDTPTTAAAPLMAQIKKGKKKHVLTVSATVVTSLPLANPQNIVISLSVNGFPVPSSVGQNCDVGNACSVTGVWVLDLDQAELDQPGLYLKQPLDIQLSMQDGFANVASSIDMTLIARLEKKK